ncbi:RluA family pseudouridine synthase [Candidatus Riesia pediculischaeffi]|uniref:Pseudouridine synthase n=1 Tax=Candidatus Riesia pediculischaeffi TaxID=428411 RepID=A0A1V0HKA6_9ENTR|nr:RluA family pseudouridine synthase [Candidatus Riesia pediculischaeffi]ARC53255.1 hypothetical protein AOQ87_00930 [Candidatus Riesia pediculischaeffi]
MKFNLIFVDKNFWHQRIDNFLFRTFKNVPKSLIYRFIRIGKIKINDRKIDPKYKVETKDIIKIPISFPYRKDIQYLPQKSKFYWIKKRVIYEDSEILVLDKPSGIPVHSGSKSTFGIIEILRQVFRDGNYLELIHRIDKETSGILLLARSITSLRTIQNQFRLKTVIKRYIFLAHGIWPDEVDRISCTLSKKKIKRRRIGESSKYDEKSETLFTVKERFSSFTLMVATPTTGRNHQIRLHAKYVNHPIVLDKRYGNRELDKLLKKSGLKRLFLHARSITINHPKNLVDLTFLSPIDKNLEQCLMWIRENDRK